MSLRAGAGLALMIGLSAAAGCGSAQEQAPAPAPRPRATSSFDPCEGEGPPEKAYEGVLREARCEQEVFLTMARVAESLDVGCGHCHVPKAGGGANEFEFPTMTPNKETANWMKHQLVDRLRHRDGSAVTCASCHVDDAGEPVRKILGEPRDPKRAMEWMSLFLVNELVRADGGKLRCKDCHGAPPGMAGFQGDLILARELSALPVRDDRPPPGRAADPPAPVESAPPAPVESAPPAPVESAPPAPVESAPPAPVESAPPAAPPPAPAEAADAPQKSE